MKIGVDAHVFDEKFQGSRTYLEGIYLEAIRMRPTWEFFFFAKNVATLEMTFGKHQNVHFIALTSSNKYQRLLFEFPRVLRKYKIDYAHFQYIAPPIRACHYFVTTHDILFLENRFKNYFPWKYRFINGKLFKRSAKQSSFVLTVSDYSKEKVIQHFKLPSNKVYVTPNAVKKPIFERDIEYINKRYGINNYLLYVSRVEPRKNHLALAKAFFNLELHSQGYSLVFIGANDLPYPELDAYLEQQPESIKEKVYQFPGISGKDLQQFYANAVAFVYPSLAEGFGIPPLEAAMVGTPVICSNATAMEDFQFFQHHIDPQNQDALENAIMDVLRGNTEDAELVKKKIEERYRWEESASIMLKALEENNQRK